MATVTGVEGMVATARHVSARVEALRGDLALSEEKVRSGLCAVVWQRCE